MPPKAFLSFSGGKDSHLSLWKAKAAGFDVVALLSMVQEDGVRSSSHRIPVDILRRQSEALGIPIILSPTSWETYEERFCARLVEFQKQGVTFGIFGDIDLPEHREWVERVCAQCGVTPFLPLWGQAHEEVAYEVIRVGFEAYVTVVRDGVLPVTFLGRRFDRTLFEELVRLGVDPCGEKGEFHTLVVSGPLYRAPIAYRFGNVAFDGRCHYLEVF